MKTKILGLLAAGLLAGPMVADASYLYMFESTDTGNSISFTVPDILTGTQDPLTQVIGQTYGGITIVDAVFGLYFGEYCFAISNSEARNCGVTGSAATVSTFVNATTVGVYSLATGFSIGGLPVVDRLTISRVAAVPEPGTLALLGLGLAGLGLSRRRKAA